MVRTYPCLHCLASSSVELRLDRKGRPYSTCRSCGTRSFLHSRAALRGLMLLGDHVRDFWANAAGATTTLEHADQAVDGAIAAGTLPYGRGA